LFIFFQSQTAVASQSGSGGDAWEEEKKELQAAVAEMGELPASKRAAAEAAVEAMSKALKGAQVCV
jgi:hypothetical protein